MKHWRSGEQGDIGHGLDEALWPTRDFSMRCGLTGKQAPFAMEATYAGQVG